MEVDGWSTLNTAEIVDKALANGFRVAFTHLQLVELKVDQWRWYLARKLAFSCIQTHNLVLTSLETRLQLRFGSLFVFNASCYRMFAWNLQHGFINGDSDQLGVTFKDFRPLGIRFCCRIPIQLRSLLPDTPLTINSTRAKRHRNHSIVTRYKLIPREPQTPRCSPTDKVPTSIVVLLQLPWQLTLVASPSFNRPLRRIIKLLILLRNELHSLPYSILKMPPSPVQDGNQIFHRVSRDLPSRGVNIVRRGETHVRTQGHQLQIGFLTSLEISDPPCAYSMRLSTTPIALDQVRENEYLFAQGSEERRFT